MSWVKLEEGVSYLQTPCLGKIKPTEGERFMALCIDPSSFKPYRGLARQVISRKGSEDVPGFVDRSKLIIVESQDLLVWKIVNDLNIQGIDKIIPKIEIDKTEFIGLEDPDIIVDNGNKHVYFTIAYKRIGKPYFDVCLGHAVGKDLDTLTATMPALGFSIRGVGGFKELAFCQDNYKRKYHLVECSIKNSSQPHPICAVTCENLKDNWNYSHVVLFPLEMSQMWCRGELSPCRILPRDNVHYGKRLHILIINGREKEIRKNKKRIYGKFKPGLSLYDPETGEIPWVDSEPLFSDPDSTGITFASEFVPLDKEHGLLYCHVNDSFVRAYKISYASLKKRLTNVILK